MRDVREASLASCTMGRHGSKLDELNIGLSKALYLANENLDLYKIIALNAGFIESRGRSKNFFAHIRKLALDAFVIDICKIYENGGKNELNTIPQILAHLQKEQLKPLHPKPLETFIQEYIGDLSELDAVIERLKGVLGTFIKKNKSHFKSFKYVRDKIIAHSEFAAYKDSLPSYDVMDKLLFFGIDFYSAIHRAYIGGVPVDYKRDKRMFHSARTLLKDLGLKDVKEDFDD